MKILKIILSLTITSFLSGCMTSSHTTATANSAAVKEISKSNSFFIAVENDGAYGNIIYTGSGLEVERVLEKKVSQYTPKVTCADKLLTLDNAKQAAIKAKCDYLIFSRIRHWEDRATFASGLPDVAEVRTSIYNTKTDQIIDSFNVGGSSAPTTLLSSKPVDLLDYPYNKYFDSLFNH